MTREPKRTKNGSPSSKTTKAERFVEELAWLVQSYSSLDWKDVSRVLTQKLRGNAATAAVGSYVSANPNKQFLVGALPRVFMDDTLFPTNEDIAQFAETVMELRIPRFSKKSKHEIIGHVVCETDRLDDAKLARLVSALAALADGDTLTKNFIRERKAANFGWNAIIQELASKA